MKRWLLIALLIASPVLAADRHVLLDIDGDGFADPCPNPAHDDYLNADGLIACNGTDVFDIDNDGSAEAIYCHPQACLYEMAKSDSCEIHAGTYRAAGAMCDEDCWSAVNDACDRGDCWFASVYASGHFQDGHTDGYGTSGSPGYLRGASMLGSTDTWDADNDKIPDADEGALLVYAPIFSGDRDNDGAYDAMGCGSQVGQPANTCIGDSFFGVYLGCGDADNTSTFCDSSPQAGSTYPKVDTDGNGTFDTQLGSGRMNVDHLIVKDIQFTRYTGGHSFGSSGQGLRQHGGHLGLWGAGDTEGLKYDHIMFGGTQYSVCAGSGCENWWSVFQDEENSECAAGGEAEIKNSYVEVNNRNFYNDDCDSESPGNSECGCAVRIHDNIIHMNGGSSRQHLAYLKSIDTLGLGTRKKDHRFWNNDIVWESSNAGFWLWDAPQGFGNSMGQGQGELWFYGNIVRIRGSGTFSRLWYGLSCAANTGSWRFYHFNNTYDLETSGGSTRSIDKLCSQAAGALGGEITMEKNNAFYKATAVHATDGTTLTRENAVCSQGGQASCTQNASGRTGWWTVGTQSAAVTAGAVTYIPLGGGPLDNVSTNTPCDPDDDGAPGVDYNGDGVNDLTWMDLAGNTVACPTSSSTLDIGAIQNDSDASAVTSGPSRGVILRGVIHR